jgi:hypothetical protein
MIFCSQQQQQQQQHHRKVQYVVCRPAYMKLFNLMPEVVVLFWHSVLVSILNEFNLFAKKFIILGFAVNAEWKRNYGCAQKHFGGRENCPVPTTKLFWVSSFDV